MNVITTVPITAAGVPNEAANQGAMVPIACFTFDQSILIPNTDDSELILSGSIISRRAG